MSRDIVVAQVQAALVMLRSVIEVFSEKLSKRLAVLRTLA
jgi:hypothetical protein